MYNYGGLSPRIVTVAVRVELTFRRTPVPRDPRDYLLGLGGSVESATQPTGVVESLTVTEGLFLGFPNLEPLERFLPWGFPVASFRNSGVEDPGPVPEKGIMGRGRTGVSVGHMGRVRVPNSRVWCSGHSSSSMKDPGSPTGLLGGCGLRAEFQTPVTQLGPD